VYVQIQIDLTFIRILYSLLSRLICVWVFFAARAMRNK